MSSTPTKFAVSSPDRIRGIQRRTLGVLSGAQIVGGVGVAVGLALSSVVVDELSGSTVISGFAGTATVLGAALLALPIAKVAGRGGRRVGLALAYLAALLGCLISVTAIGLANWPLLLAGLVLVGGGSAGNLAARYSATDLSPPGHAARHLSLVVWAATIGSVAGPMLAEPADRIGLDAGLAGKAGPFAFSALAFAGALVIILSGLRPDPLKLARELDGTTARRQGREPDDQDRLAEPAGRPDGAHGSGDDRGQPHRDGVDHVDDPGQLHHDGSTLQVIGLVISLHIAGMYVLSPVVGWLADKAGRVPVLLLGMGCCSASAVLAGTAGHRVWQVTVALFCSASAGRAAWWRARRWSASRSRSKRPARRAGAVRPADERLRRHRHDHRRRDRGRAVLRRARAGGRGDGDTGRTLAGDHLAP